MLVCPHCQFENPDSNNFCQSCGGSLTETVCPSCGEPTPLDLKHCPHCGSMTGTIWRAILSLSGKSLANTAKIVNARTTNEISDETLGLDSTLPEVEQPSSSNSVLVEGKYLDLQQRYQLLQPLPDRLDQVTEVEVNVLDCQPLQPALLEVLHHHSLSADPLTATDYQSTDYQLAVPPIAQPYLEMQECYPSLPLPEVHDAWEQDGLSVVLLQDRTDLPRLIDVCQDENVLPLQILRWLYEMVEHWEALQPHHYAQSLLKIDNLRVDQEDDVLCLQRLYLDPPAASPQLQNLGNLWQTLFEQSQRTQNGSLFLLCRDLVSETITTVEELRSRIAEIATAMQTSAAAATALPADPPDGKPIPPVAPAVAAVGDGASVTPSAGNAGKARLPAPAQEESVNENDDQPTVVLPMRLISIEEAGRTFTGRQRDHNEDCFYIQTDSKKTEIKKLEDAQERTVHARGIYLLCDGMGGHAGGEVASALAVETLRTYFESTWQDNKLPDEQSIRKAIQLANQAIYDENQGSARSGSGRMGTTLVLLLLQDAEVAIAHVGDSRLYRFSRRQGLEQLTQDHEVGQREIQRGVEPSIAYARPDAYQLTQALGPRDENFIHPDVKFLELNEDMLLLLCSDGLTDNDFLELHWQSHLQPLLSQGDLEQGLNQLVEDANQFNGHDNITGVVVRVRVRPNFTQLGY